MPELITVSLISHRCVVCVDEKCTCSVLNTQKERKKKKKEKNGFKLLS